jgi:hypothetical protein
MSVVNNNKALVVDMDFDTDGRIYKDLLDTPRDPVMQTIVRRIVSGEQVSRCEYEYYERGLDASGPAG